MIFPRYSCAFSEDKFVRFRIHAPNFVHQLLPREYFSWIGEQFEQQIELYDRLIRFYFDTGDFKGASDLFLEFFTDAAREKRLAFADGLLRAGAFGEAEEWYKSCIENTSYYSYPYLSRTGGEESGQYGYFVRRALRKGDQCFRSEWYKEALAQYAHAAKVSDYAKRKQAECCFMLKDFEKAKNLYRELVQKTDDAYLKFMLAECYNSEEVDVNTFEDALYWYEYALEGGCELVYYHLGLCYQFGRGTEEDLGKAEKIFEEGTKHKVDAGDCYCKLGNLAYMRGETEKAAENYRKAAKLNNARACEHRGGVSEQRDPLFPFRRSEMFSRQSGGARQPQGLRFAERDRAVTEPRPQRRGLQRGKIHFKPKFFRAEFFGPAFRYAGLLNAVRRDSGKFLPFRGGKTGRQTEGGNCKTGAKNVFRPNKTKKMY